MLSFLGGVLFKQLPPQLLKVSAVCIPELFETHRTASHMFKAVCQHVCLLWLYCDVLRLRSMPKTETSNQLGSVESFFESCAKVGATISYFVTTFVLGDYMPGT